MKLVRPFLTLFTLALVAILVAPEAAPRAASGPQRVGVIHQGGTWQTLIEGLREGCRELGIEDGKQIVLDLRDTGGDLKAAEAAAKDLERARAEVIVAVGTSVTTVAKRVTTQVPIVFLAGVDPVAAGLVESFAKPGGRLTGIHSQVRDLTVKRLEILKQLMPKLSRILTIYNPSNPTAETSARMTREMAKQMNLQLVERHARSVDELHRTLLGVKAREFDAFFQVGDSMVIAQAGAIIERARELRLPTMFHETNLCEKGGSFCYGQSYREAGRLAAKFVQRILAGTSPKDLPVENFSKADLVLNLRTAKHVGVTIPPTVLLRAERVIE